MSAPQIKRPQPTQLVWFAMIIWILLAAPAGLARARSPQGAGADFSVTPNQMEFADKVIGVSGETSWPKRLIISFSGESGQQNGISDISISGPNRADFKVHHAENCGQATLTTGCAVTVTFTPTALGLRTATLTLTDSSGAIARQVALTGRGIKGSIKWQPRELSFGKVRPGALSAPQPVSITNPNATPLTITRIALNSSDFVATQTCVGPLAPHASCRFFVTAKPPSAMAKSKKDTIKAQLEIEDDAAGNPHRVALSAVLHGSPVAPPPPPPPAALTSAILVTNTPCNNVTSYAIGMSGDAVPTFPQPLLCNPTGIAVDTSKKIYVTNSGIDGNPSYSVAIYAAGSTGEVAPTSVIVGAATGLDVPQGIALDSANNIYVVNDGSDNGDSDSITIYPAGSSGNMAPTTISGSKTGLSLPSGVAIDNVGKNIYVANAGTNTVTVYPESASGDAAPSATIQGFTTGLTDPLSVAVDSTSKIYVLNGGNDSVTVYPAGSNGDIAPNATISGGNTLLSASTAIALDGANNIYVTNSLVSFDAVIVFPAGSNGDVTPSAVISTGILNVKTFLDAPAAIALDNSGAIYVANAGSQNGDSDTVTVYPPGSAGIEAPSATIIGSNTELNAPEGIAIDGTNIYVVNCSGFYCGNSPSFSSPSVMSLK